METKWKTLPARRAGKPKKLPARAKICLPDLADKCWYMFWISKYYININITPVSAVGASKILRSRFWRHKVCISLSKVTCPAGQASLKSYLPGSKFACPGQAGRRFFPTLQLRRLMNRRCEIKNETDVGVKDEIKLARESTETWNINAWCVRVSWNWQLRA